ncbi:tyrosine-type recombinase/integrase [Candidatus Latescibacterota bacterium]
MAVYKRNNVWYIDYNIYINGKRKRRREPVGNRKDVAELRLKECNDLISQGIDPERERGSTDSENTIIPMKSSENLYFKDFIPIFLELHGNFQSLKMQESYRTSLFHLLPVLKKVRLFEISKIGMKTYVTNRKLEGASNSTVNREISFVKSVLNRATEWEYIDKNPLKALKLLREPPIRERYLTREEADRLLEASPKHLRDIIVLALATGMRKTEIFNLTWKDITIYEGFKSGQISIVGKGNKRRNIRMNQTVYELLVKPYKEKSGLYVFPSIKTGKRIIKVDKAFKTALKRTGIEDFRFHDLRHTAASWMVQSGASIYAVKDILGHSNVRTTQRYAHHSPEYLGTQINLLDDYFSHEKTVEKSTKKQKIEAVG